MGELTQTELHSSNSPITQQLWNAMLNLLGFFFQIFSQIIAPFTNYPLISSFSSSRSFDPLPTFDSPEPPTSAVEITSAAVDHRPLQKLTVVLDLDETLVCAYETSSLPASLCAQATEAGLNWFELECLSSENEVDVKPKTSFVTVFERPGLKEFLRQVSQFADIVLFTAGLEGYARPLVDRIDTENRISRRLYRPSTISTEYREHVKDLTCISKDLRRIVIVDNNPFSFLLQPDNGIPCVSFSAGQPHDTQLLDVILPLLKHLSNQRSVRHVLHERFCMREWFQQQGIPASG
ncbi:putative protein-serine/threonine phosphatase [Lupinus albus]|uniref:FCP1 homology domain-containing protein n=1 Tax=Lupinus albus TaxID=3870 RepID=A0A6A4NM27_LUPAL|nr:putative protein-serine/threonine phosphatase [Lupinus albus]